MLPACQKVPAKCLPCLQKRHLAMQGRPPAAPGLDELPYSTQYR